MTDLERLEKIIKREIDSNSWSHELLVAAAIVELVKVIRDSKQAE